MKLAVIGTGHVGLVTAVVLSHLGHEVVGTDVDREKISSLQQGNAPFFEPALDEMLTEGLGSGRLAFRPDIADAVDEAAMAFICVGTPPRASGHANLVSVEQSARHIARHATRPMVVVEKSTVPAGTARRLRGILERDRPDLEFDIVSNPEFLREGRAIHDSLEPDRILVGAESRRGFEAMREVYEPLTRKGIPLIEADLMTAELAKHASNAFLALKVSFANAMARLSEHAGADVVKVSEIMGSDPRIGPAFLQAGLGYGGSCFPKDLAAFERLAAELGFGFPLLTEIARINEQAIDAAAEKVREALWNLDDKRVALLGLAFKPETDDVRFSPALALAERLLAEGARVVGYDPKASTNAKAEVPGLEIAMDAFGALTGAHCAVLCTEWTEFATLDLTRVKEVMAYPTVIDGRNLFDPETMRTLGFSYYPTGRPPVIPDQRTP